MRKDCGIINIHKMSFNLKLMTIMQVTIIMYPILRL